MPKRSSARAKTRTQVPAAYVVGAMLAAAGLVAQPHAASAQSLDTVLKRLEALENSNAKLQQENTVLRDRVRRIEGAKPALAASPAPIMAAAPAGAGGPAIVGKAAPNRWVDATTVTIYGHADLSLDFFDTGVRDVDPAVTGPALGNARHAAVASNLTYLGVRATHDLTNYGYAGWAALLQYETLVETAATPSERAALGSRDSYLGIQGPYGAVKLGKSDTPYKKSTALFDPWRNTIGDYNSIMGNTGGDARAEFDARLPHAIWYESPLVYGFQLSAMVSPGQNLAADNSANPLGEFNCSGSTPRSSGSGFPSDPFGAGTCTDGSFGTAYSVALTFNQNFKNGPVQAVAAYERHMDVNRTGDEAGIVTGIGIQDEWAAKGGVGVQLPTQTQIFGIYEHMERESTNPLFNERTRNGTYVSLTQPFGPWQFSAAWAHAFKTPGDPGIFSGVVGDAQNQADMYTAGVRYNFDKDFSVYLVGAVLQNGPGAHYCLGASGHGFAICSRDGINDTHPGTDIKAISMGLTYVFSADIIGTSAAPAPLVSKY